MSILNSIAVFQDFKYAYQIGIPNTYSKISAKSPKELIFYDDRIMCTINGRKLVLK